MMRTPKRQSFLFLFFGIFVLLSSWGQEDVDENTGLIIDKGLKTVKAHCTGCHSAQLIIQSRATRQGWKETIRWMQQTQNLWQFDAQTEEIILNYLAKHYAPESKGRRPNLKVKEWYFLEAEESVPSSPSTGTTDPGPINRATNLPPRPPGNPNDAALFPDYLN